MGKVIITDEIERKIIEYINSGYANWEILRILQEKEELKNIGVFYIRKIKREFIQTLTDEQKAEIKRKEGKRQTQYKYATEIEKVKRGYTPEEIAIDIINSNKKQEIRRIEDRINKYVKLGIINIEEMNLAREKRNTEREKNENKEEIR